MDIFVGNIPYSANEDQLGDLFAAHGQVTSVKILTDRETGRSRGMAFITMPDDNEAQSAIDALNGTELDGRSLRVDQARPREDRPPGRDFGGGGGGGGGYERRGGGGGGYDRRGGGGGGRQGGGNFRRQSRF